MEREQTDICLSDLSSKIPSLDKDTVHIWCLPLDLPRQARERCFSLLSIDEKTRADRFYFDTSRQHFIAGRGWLRRLLGNYLGIEPSVLKFDYDSHGKPKLNQSWMGHRLQFNVSHSEDLGVIIIGLDRQVGIDIEYMRALADVDDLARRFFTVQESALLSTYSGKGKQEIFYKVWTCKEAYLKALGEGLAGALNQVEIRFQSRIGTQTDSRNVPEFGGWQLGTFSPRVNYQGAFAVEGVPQKLLFQPNELMGNVNLEMMDYSLFNV